MDKRKRIPVKDVKQIAYEIGLWAIDIETLNLKRKPSKPSDIIFKEKFDDYIDSRIQMVSDRLDHIDVVEEISQLEVHEYWSYPREISPDSINNRIQALGIAEDITENWNGHDLDWSIIDPLKINDKEYRIWGCATSGSFMFQRSK